MYPALVQIWKYCTSFWGIIDLLTIGPFYLQYFGITDHSMAVLRVLRLARMARLQILTRDKFDKEMVIMKHTMQNAGRSILALLSVFVLILLLAGAIMYFLEGVRQIGHLHCYYTY